MHFIKRFSPLLNIFWTPWEKRSDLLYVFSTSSQRICNVFRKEVTKRTPSQHPLKIMFKIFQNIFSRSCMNLFESNHYPAFKDLFNIFPKALFASSNRCWEDVVKICCSVGVCIQQVYVSFCLHCICLSTVFFLSVIMNRPKENHYYRNWYVYTL